MPPQNESGAIRAGDIGATKRAELSVPPPAPYSAREHVHTRAATGGPRVVDGSADSYIGRDTCAKFTANGFVMVDEKLPLLLLLLF